MPPSIAKTFVLIALQDVTDQGVPPHTLYPQGMEEGADDMMEEEDMDWEDEEELAV